MLLYCYFIKVIKGLWRFQFLQLSWNQIGNVHKSCGKWSNLAHSIKNLLYMSQKNYICPKKSTHLSKKKANFFKWKNFLYLYEQKLISLNGNFFYFSQKTIFEKCFISCVFDRDFEYTHHFLCVSKTYQAIYVVLDWVLNTYLLRKIYF